MRPMKTWHSFATCFCHYTVIGPIDIFVFLLLRTNFFFIFLNRKKIQKFFLLLLLVGAGVCPIKQLSELLSFSTQFSRFSSEEHATRAREYFCASVIIIFIYFLLLVVGIQYRNGTFFSEANKNWTIGGRKETHTQQTKHINCYRKKL